MPAVSPNGRQLAARLIEDKNESLLFFDLKTDAWRLVPVTERLKKPEAGK